jgi:hygromycin-B 4-O-kinase
VNERAGVSQSEAEAFLRSRLGPGVEAVSRIARGEWSKAYSFRLDGAGYVARFSAVEDDFAKDRLAARYASANLPIPRIVQVGPALGGFYAISERAEGSYIDEVDESQMRALLPSLFAALDAMRSAELSTTRGFGGWGAEGHAPHASWRQALLAVSDDSPGGRIHGWRKRLETSPLGAAPFDEAYAHLEALVEHLPEERQLVHSDLLHFNVLVEGERITAVLDWGSSIYGDFLYDIAWLSFWAPWVPPAWDGIDFRLEAERHYASIGLDVPRFEERLRACQIHIGLDGKAYTAWRGGEDLEATARRTLEVARGD